MDRKREASEDRSATGPQSKRVRVQAPPRRAPVERVPSGTPWHSYFDLLSDDIMLVLLSHLPHVDLVHLGQTSPRLARITGDPSLWVWVTIGTPVSLSQRELMHMVKQCGRRTQSLKIHGCLAARDRAPVPREDLSSSLMRVASQGSPDLRELELVGCYFDVRKLPLKELPPNLTHLAVINCEAINLNARESYFRDIKDHFGALRVLNLTGNLWLSNHSLMALAKIETLEELVLLGCNRIGECFAYSALAAKYGFARLRRLDVRNTSVSDSEITGFIRMPQLREILIGKTSADVYVDAPGEGDGYISDRALISLTTLVTVPQPGRSTLQVLVMTYCGITNRVMPKLGKACPSLQVVDVTGTEVTDAGRGALLACLPDCQVIGATDYEMPGPQQSLEQPESSSESSAESSP